MGTRKLPDKAEIRDRVVDMIDRHIEESKAAVIKNWLDSHKFYDAPASTKYHGAYAGGLAEHSLAVAKNLETLTEKLDLEWSNPSSPYVIGLLHDVCKADQYTYNCATGLYEYRKDSIFSHHGEKSICMLASCLTLTEEEVACIRWHMGAYETDTKEWSYYGNAIQKYPNVLWTHTADMMASHIEGV